MILQLVMTFTSLLFCTGAVIVYAMVQNRLRTKTFQTNKLFPNCLLTRFPILFVAGAESLFYKGNYWNSIPQILRDHGYEVFDLHPIGKNADERQQDLQNFAGLLFREGMSFHCICTAQDTVGLQKLNLLYPGVFRSITAPDPKDLKSSWEKNMNLLLHKIRTGLKDISSFQVGYPGFSDFNQVTKFYLSIVVRLAEQDLQQHEEANDSIAQSLRT